MNAQLFNRRRGCPAVVPATAGVSEEDIASYCDAHGVTFFATGECPAGDTNLGFESSDGFAVLLTSPGARNRIIPVKYGQVQSWKHSHALNLLN